MRNIFKHPFEMVLNIVGPVVSVTVVVGLIGVVIGLVSCVVVLV